MYANLESDSLVRLPIFPYMRANKCHTPQLPADDGIQEWLLQRWQAKDALLQHFYEHGARTHPD